MDCTTDLSSVVNNLPSNPRILVLGDLMLDRYTTGIAERVSQEAPVLVLSSKSVEHRLGGAASVANMVAALGADVVAAGVVGDDAVGEQLKRSLQDASVSTEFVVTDSERQTTLKERFVGRNGSGLPSQILRVDTESKHDLNESIERRLVELVTSSIDDFDAVLISDYAKGVCTRRLLNRVISVANEAAVPTLVDPGRDRDFSIYRNVSLIKPNRIESSLAIGKPIRTHDEAINGGAELCNRFDIDAAIITLDSDGMCLVTHNGEGQIFSTTARSVYDITGAGDMVLSVLGLCLAGGVQIENAIQIANVAAGLEIDRAGVAVLNRSEIANGCEQSAGKARKAITLQQAADCAEEFRRKGKTIAFTNGCFDLLHVGHVTYLEEAASLADVLIVGVNSDSSVRQLKGPERPVIHEHDRLAMLSALSCVDHVILFSSETPCDIIRAVRPDVLVKGGTYTTDQVVGHEIVEAYGGKVCVTNVVDGVSTTRIVDSLTNRTTLRKAG
ncbi:MAG: D-glycero-beta-D-manno-heptose 1-phosphate adenylyltransferase [Planctomycetales bacterium]|nr:D-glycero-beta-D-manno-heptose 1-phosphate adenylyltransferase [Planctomycetales bacterium]